MQIEVGEPASLRGGIVPSTKIIAGSSGLLLVAKKGGQAVPQLKGVAFWKIR